MWFLRGVESPSIAIPSTKVILLEEIGGVGRSRHPRSRSAWFQAVVRALSLDHHFTPRPAGGGTKTKRSPTRPIETTRPPATLGRWRSGPLAGHDRDFPRISEGKKKEKRKKRGSAWHGRCAPPLEKTMDDGCPLSLAGALQRMSALHR